eukprot:TRINITY_DN62844_c0_g1_i1.p1 TRINITY_DN62844_c0_g1~~TRINITY_DN62844_c0_g1_i1.p1  ORF type:complete len:244 (-),score=60.66 TRINITY_DN62844_c0_g1_i1:231-962(-)
MSPRVEALEEQPPYLDESGAASPDAAFSYDLLLKKSGLTTAGDAVPKCCAGQAAPSLSGVSTAEPQTPCSSSVLDTASAAPPENRVVLLRNVSVHGPHADERLPELIRQTRELSQAVFKEDCLQEITKKSHWKLTLLTSDDLSVLCGFLVTKTTCDAIAVAKIAVPLEFRGLGFGKRMMEDLVKAAKKQSDVYEVCLSSLSTAVTFYQRLGFKALTAYKVKTDFEVQEGQVYMVKKLRPRPRK